MSMSNSNSRLPRGIRNNNPLNIKLGQRWKGLSSSQTDGTFCVFISMNYGYRAAAICMRTYVRKHGCRTLRDIISRWTSTDRGSYMQYVSSSCGIGLDEDISSLFTYIYTDAIRATDRYYRLANILLAMASYENGSYMKDGFIRFKHYGIIRDALTLIKN